MPAEYPEPLSFGQRLKIQRTRRGMPREVLGGLVGRSASWVKALETGRLKEPRLPVLLQLAEALRVRDLAGLTGHANQHVDLFTGPGHRYLPAVRAAIDSLVITTDRQAPPVEHLRARLDHAWAARHASPYHREVLDAAGDGAAAGRGVGCAGRHGVAERHKWGHKLCPFLWCPIFTVGV